MRRLLSAHFLFYGGFFMLHLDSIVKKARTIEMLEICDVLEIVVRDLNRYGVPDKEINNFVLEHVIPLKVESEKLKFKYTEK